MTKEFPKSKCANSGKERVEEGSEVGFDLGGKLLEGNIVEFGGEGVDGVDVGGVVEVGGELVGGEFGRGEHVGGVGFYKEAVERNL